MKWDVPLQLLQRRTMIGKGGGMQEKATRAWTFCTGQHYKADGMLASQAESASSCLCRANSNVVYRLSFTVFFVEIVLEEARP